MKIISGKYKGRKIEGYDILGTRPTMDRVKESLFGMIGPYIKGSICLDLFAGTGSLGLEALSMGADKCIFIDENRKCTQSIEKTVRAIQIEESASVITGHYQKALHTYSREGTKFDIIFLDPPYHLHIITPILTYIYENNLLNENGIIVCEYETEKIETNHFRLYKERNYGSKRIQIYK